jgi:hypothetical protein
MFSSASSWGNPPGRSPFVPQRRGIGDPLVFARLNDDAKYVAFHVLPLRSSRVVPDAFVIIIPVVNWSL